MPGNGNCIRGTADHRRPGTGREGKEGGGNNDTAARVRLQSVCWEGEGYTIVGCISKIPLKNACLLRTVLCNVADGDEFRALPM